MFYEYFYMCIVNKILTLCSDRFHRSFRNCKTMTSLVFSGRYLTMSKLVGVVGLAVTRFLLNGFRYTYKICIHMFLVIED